MKDLRSFLSFFRYYLGAVFSPFSGPHSTFSKTFAVTAEYQATGTYYSHFKNKFMD